MPSRRDTLGWFGAAMAAALPGCAPAVKESEPAAQKSRSLRIALSVRPGSLDPAIAMSAEQGVPALAAYQRLVRSAGLGSFTGDLAQTWGVSKSGLVWDFQLDPEARFADGSPVEASAVAFSFERLIALGRGPASDATEQIAAVEPQGPHQVRFLLRRPSPTFLGVLAARPASIVNPAVRGQGSKDDWGAAWLSTRSAGSGAYEVVESGGGLHRLRVSRFTRAAPYFQEILYQEIPDPAIRGLAAQAGEVDVAVLMPPLALRQAARNPNLRVLSVPTFAFQNLAFNMESPTFQDLRLRQAVAAAIDVNAILLHIRDGRADRFDGPLLPGMAGADPKLYPVRYDPPLAKQLAHAALQGRSIRARTVYPGVSPETDTLAQYLQAQLAELGIRLQLERLSVAAYIDRLTRGAYDLALMGFVARRPDANAILSAWFEPARAGMDNPARYGSPEISAWIAAAALETDPNKQADLHRRIIMRVNADLPYVYLQRTHVAVIARSELKGLELDEVEPLAFPVSQMWRAT